MQFPLFEKSVLATVLLLLAGMQLIVISIARGWIGGYSTATRRKLLRWHRGEGYAGLIIILVLALACIFLASPVSNQTPRAAVHALLGAGVVGVITGKVLIARFFTGSYRRLPGLGVTLFSAIILAWLTSAAWWFFQYFTGVGGEY